MREHHGHKKSYIRTLQQKVVKMAKIYQLLLMIE